MKLPALLTALLLTTATFAQSEGYNQTTGYVNGQKLSAIIAPVAQVTINTGSAMLYGGIVKRYGFDYGQKYKSEKEIHVTDSTGKILTFQSTAGAINFFDYNGWELIQFYPAEQAILLRRKKG